MKVLPRFKTQRTVIVLLQPEHADRVLSYYQKNRQHLSPWEPQKPPAFYSLENTELRLTQYLDNFVCDRGYHFAAFTLDFKEVVGICNFTNVVRGAFQACHLGYSVAAAQENKGLMREILKPTLHYMFNGQDIHRIMANVMPSNERSLRLLLALGFEKEGYAKDYLKIAGLWQDHILTAKIRNE